METQGWCSPSYGRPRGLALHGDRSAVSSDTAAAMAGSNMAASLGNYPD